MSVPKQVAIVPSLSEVSSEYDSLTDYDPEAHDLDMTSITFINVTLIWPIEPMTLCVVKAFIDNIGLLVV